MYTKAVIEMFLMEHLGDHNSKALKLFVVGREKTFYHGLLLASLLMHEWGGHAVSKIFDITIGAVGR